jgi:hypothetical protein
VLRETAGTCKCEISSSDVTQVTSLSLLRDDNRSCTRNSESGGTFNTNEREEKHIQSFVRKT